LFTTVSAEGSLSSVLLKVDICAAQGWNYGPGNWAGDSELCMVYVGEWETDALSEPLAVSTLESRWSLSHVAAWSSSFLTSERSWQAFEVIAAF
jgi:hypothetical protein